MGIYKQKIEEINDFVDDRYGEAVDKFQTSLCKVRKLGFAYESDLDDVNAGDLAYSDGAIEEHISGIVLHLADIADVLSGAFSSGTQMRIQYDHMDNTYDAMKIMQANASSNIRDINSAFTHIINQFKDDIQPELNWDIPQLFITSYQKLMSNFNAIRPLINDPTCRKV